MSIEKRLKLFFGGLAIAILGAAMSIAASWLRSFHFSDAAIGQPITWNILSTAPAFVLWGLGLVTVFLGLGRIVEAFRNERGAPEYLSRKPARSYRARLALPVALFIGFPVVYRWSSQFASDVDVRRWFTFCVITIFCATWIAWAYRRPPPDPGKVNENGAAHHSVRLRRTAYLPEGQSMLGKQKRAAQVILLSIFAAALGWLVFDTVVCR